MPAWHWLNQNSELDELDYLGLSARNPGILGSVILASKKSGRGSHAE